MSDGLVTLDDSGNIIFANSSLLKISGYNVSELYGKKVNILFAEKNMYFLQEGDVSLRAEYHLTLVSRTWLKIPVNVSVTGLEDRYGINSGYICIVRDLREEQAISKKENDLKWKLAVTMSALKEKKEELDSLNSTILGRESRMISIKKEINSMLLQSGRKARYREGGVE